MVRLTGAALPRGRGWTDGLRALADPVSLVLAAVASASIVALGVLRLLDAPDVVELGMQTVLLGGFAWLAARDLRLAASIAIVELVLAGAGGRWTLVAGLVPGRIVLDAIVFVAAVARLAERWRRTGKLELGRYGAHALAVAALMGAVWIPVALLNGNDPREIFGDVNGYLFLAFVLVIVVLMSDGQAGWLRQTVFVACAANALFYGLILVLAFVGIAPLYPVVRDALLVELSFGGAVGFMPSGAWRLYLASGLFLQVGLAMVTWRLMRRPTAALWILDLLLLVAIAVSYTRGFWIASIVTVALILALGPRSLRRTTTVVAGKAGLVAATVLVGAVVGFSVPDYLLQRASSTLTARPVPSPSAPAQSPSSSRSPGSSPSLPPSGGPTPSPGATQDVLGEISNQIRIEQVRIIGGHIAKSPILGHGFGAIARDYPYDDISRYEISYLDLAFKTGLLGSLIFLSFPIRLLVDAVRCRLGRLRGRTDVPRDEYAVPFAIVATILAVSVTNPYLFAAFGLAPLLLCIAWLDPLGELPSASRA